eukprot:CAMPEP_0174994944 /NCGR_PEP_ID=MMETSP0004_2-20121128/23917_1 /TAXON_ID=420556 /ORGANISM="Ochromonas sp., Strain CCMP1393" /LENGTH=441 /DNA_ID=CAMNT_0016249237 /DNA_START=110 /DNA_END=1435 /DNA_ORIENTATION=-
MSDFEISKSTTLSTTKAADGKFSVGDANRASATARTILRNRSVEHTALPQTGENIETSSRKEFSFVVAADPQFGINTASKNWDREMAYSEKAVKYINRMSPRPAFVSMCGDLADMEPSMFEGKYGSRDQCIATQEKQYDDFKRIWRQLHESIPILCMCGNHDVGNNPTKESIERFKSKFGDDYFSFWCNGCFLICLNTNIYSNYSNVPDLYEEQHEWLKAQLDQVRGDHLAARQQARRVFLFGHHPWFLFDENETIETTKGINQCPSNDPNDTIPDQYFPICLENRRAVLQLCRQYRVDACFAGHYHQNLVGETSFGMPMITTGGLCDWNITSSAKDLSIAGNQTPGAGIRIVTVLPSSAADGYASSTTTIEGGGGDDGKGKKEVEEEVDKSTGGEKHEDIEPRNNNGKKIRMESQEDYLARKRARNAAVNAGFTHCYECV